MMKTFAIVNRKGGVGKTTTAVNLAYILVSSCKMRVLLIDADSQGDASSICANPSEGGLNAVLRGEHDAFWENNIDHTDIEGLDLLACGEDLGDIDLQCAAGMRKADYFALSRFLEVVAEADEYDYCVIDCPPYYSVSCLNALTAADRVIIPADTTAYSAKGMAGLVKQIESIRTVVPGVRVSGCLVTGVRKSDVDTDAMAHLRDEPQLHVFRTVIRRSDEPVRASSWARQPVGQWSPWCNAARDYRAWVVELLQWEGLA